MTVSSEGAEKIEPSQPAVLSDCASESSDRSDAPSSSPNFLREIDVQSPVALRSEEYRQLFRLPPEEVLVQDFNCALQESILLQGHMYMFVHFICFYSNIFGFETKKIIPFHEVTCVRKAKTAGIFPNAIEILTDGKKFFFASFLSRDEAFKLINDGFLQHGTGVKAIIDHQESKSEYCSQVNEIIEIDSIKSPTCSISKLDSIDRNGDASVLKDSKFPLDGEDCIVSDIPSDVQDNVEKEANLFFKTDHSSSSSGKNLVWKQEDADAPKVPEYYARVAESKFPVKVEEFFTVFFSDDAVSFLESFHRRCGDKDFRCTTWYPHDKFGHARDVSFQHPIKIYFGARFGGCQEVQKFRVYRNSHLIIETSQEVSDVPYADYFHVEGLWDVESIDDESTQCCILRVYVNVSFSKKTMFRGKIEQSTVEECREAYAIWIGIAHDLLKQRKLEKEEEDSAANVIQNVQVHMDTRGQIGEPSVVSSEADDHRGSYNFQGVNQQVSKPSEENFVDATPVGSLFRELTVRLYSYLKRHCHIPLLLLITFAVIVLLMQLSIVVLLSRPREVHVISQAEYVNAMGSGVGENRAAEAVAWLDKQIHHLRDEMLMVEARLEKMRHEHTLLTAQLKDLELLRRQRK